MPDEIGPGTFANLMHSPRPVFALFLVQPSLPIEILSKLTISTGNRFRPICLLTSLHSAGSTSTHQPHRRISLAEIPNVGFRPLPQTTP